MDAHRWRGHRSPYRGISSVIATLLLVAITVIAFVVLLAFRPNLSQPTPQVWDFVQGNQSEQAWSDPTDCTNTTQYAHCNPLPAIFITVTGYQPSYVPLSSLTLTFLCNGTRLISAALPALEVVPGTGSSPGSGAPVLGSCGTWSWGSGSGFTATYFNRLLYYQQLTPGIHGIAQGDVIVIYSHPANNFCDYNGNCPDDDYHGAPLWCFAVPNACSVLVTYQSGSTNALVINVPLYHLSSSG